jgi:hypothetical protein
MAQFRHIHRIDPDMTLENARRLLASVQADLPLLRPKAARKAEQEIEAIEHDIRVLESVA